MAVTDFLPAHFEPESAVRAWSARPLARARACWPQTLEVRWPGAGRLRATLAGLATVDQQSTAGLGLCESFALWRAGRQGRLDVDARFAVGVTSAVLGASRALPMARPLSPGERGMFGALVAAALDQVGAPVQVALDVPDAVPLRLEIQAELDLMFATEDAKNVVGWARVFVPAAWVEAAPVRWEALAPLPFAAAIEVARTRLPRDVWASAGIGDAVVFAGEAARADADAFDAQVSLGPWRAPATVRSGDVRLRGPFEPVAGWPEHALPVAPPGPAWKGTGAMTTIEMLPPGAQSSADVGSTSLAQALAATPVEVVAEVGRVVLTGAEIAGLESGLVLALGTSSRGTITLSVAGRPVAKGVLVNIDGAFGVRITERF